MNRKSLPSIFVLIISMSLQLNAQSLKGVWQGFITADGLLTRALVLNIKDHTDNIITGRSYIYDIKYPELMKPFAFRGELDFIGTVDNKTCKISELVIIDSVMYNDNAFLCTKIMNIKISKEGDIDLMKGSWTGAIYSQQRCDAGFIFLKRYDFFNPPKEPMPEFVAAKIKDDTSPKIAFRKTALAKPLIIDVANPVFTLEVRDYLRQDNDTVSIYYNRNPVVKKLALRKKTKRYTIKLDKLSGLNEIIMYADNLGEIPPNTSSITVNDGITKQNVIISSSLQTSAVVYIRYNPLKTY